MQLVLLLQAAQDRDRILDRRLGHEHGLETPRERRVLLDMLAIFVERGRANAVQLAARQRGLQEVRRIHRAIRLARADERMHLVDEQDDAALGRRHLVENGLQPLLEFAAIFRAGDQRAHIEREQLLVLQRFRHVAVDDAQREALDDRRLADAGLADENGIVLGAARQNLDRATDFLVATDHRIKLARSRGLGQIAGVFLQRVIGVLGGSRIRSASLAQILDRRIQRLRRHASIAEDFRGFRTLLHRQREQQAFDRDETVAGLLRDLLRIVEKARRRGAEIELARAGTLHFRELGQSQLDLLQRLARATAGLVDQARSQSLGIVEQYFEHMLGRELLMPFADRKRLRRLDEAARALRIFFHIHADLLARRPSPVAARPRQYSNDSVP